MVFGDLSKWLLAHLNGLLFAAFAIGVALPWAALIPTWVIPAILGSVIFVTSARIRASDVDKSYLGDISIFYIIRFIIIPIIGYFAFSIFAPQFAYGVLLMLLSPVGTAAPGIIAASNGNPAISLAMVIISSLLAPVFIPIAFWLTPVGSIELNVAGVFATLSMIVLLPVGAYYFGAKHFPSLQKICNSVFGIVLSVGLFITVMVAVAHQRSLILGDLSSMAFIFLITLVIYLLLFGVGWLFARRKPTEIRRAFALSSTLNNPSLIIGIAAVFFPPNISVFVASTALTWTVALVIVQSAWARR